MFEIAHILTPVDRSEGSRTAFRVARYLANVYGATIHWAHAVPTFPPLIERVLFPYAAMGEDVHELAQELLESARVEFEDSFGINERVQGRVVGSLSLRERNKSTEHLLAEEARRVGPDLLVLSAHGESGGRPRRLGSVAGALLDAWSGPVLVTRTAGAGDKPFSEVVVVSDFGPGSDALFRTAVGLCLTAGLPLSCLTVVQDPRLADTGNLLSGVLRVEPPKFEERASKAAAKQLAVIGSNLEIPFPLREAFKALSPKVVTVFGDVVESLWARTKDRHDVLFVVGRARPSASTGLGRTAEAIVNRVPAPVLVVPLVEPT